jgi:GTPase involved in cell partitioning and DNA repair
MIAHLVSFENENMMKTYKEIRKELENYDKKSGLEDGLSSKEEIIILTKTDVVEDQKQINKTLKEFEKLDKKVFVLSLFNDESVKGFRDALVKILKK